MVYAWTTMWRCLLQWLTLTKISFPKHVGLSENLGADPKSGDVSSFLQNYHVGLPHFRTTHNYRRTTSRQLCHHKWNLGNFTCDTYCCAPPSVESSGDVCAVCDFLGNCKMHPCAAAGSRLEYVFERIGQSIGFLDLPSRWCFFSQVFIHWICGNLQETMVYFLGPSQPNIRICCSLARDRAGPPLLSCSFESKRSRETDALEEYLCLCPGRVLHAGALWGLSIHWLPQWVSRYCRCVVSDWVIVSCMFFASMFHP